MNSVFTKRSTRLVVMLLIAVGTLCVSAYAHVKAGFTLPSPWNDEPWYLWSVVSMVENNTYFSETLNPERIVVMSPYYQLPMAAVFKIVGFSYAGARWLSWFYMALAYGAVLWLIFRRPHPLFSSLVASLFFLGASAVVAGNMARPEAMVWGLVIWCFVLADHEQHWKALALAGVAVLIHPVAIVFFAGIFILFLANAWSQRLRIRPTRGDLIIMAGAGILLAIYLAWTVWFWDLVTPDRQSAMAEGLGGNSAWERFFLSNKTPWLAGYAVMVGVGLWRFRALRVPALLGAAALSTMPLRPQMWYEVYNQMSFMWMTLLIPWSLILVGGSLPGLRRIVGTRYWGYMVSLGLLIAGLLPMLKFSYAHGFITGPNNYPMKLGWGWGMGMDPHPYITEHDIETVLAEIERHVADGQRYRVFFMPEADALFFHDRMPTNTIPYHGARSRIRGDMAVFRISRHPPDWWTRQYVLRRLQIYRGEGITPFYTRDGTEQWILIPPGAVPAVQEEGVADPTPRQKSPWLRMESPLG